VSGDYYDYNVISQTNIISDVDAATQLLAAAPEGAQDLAAGGNAVTNAALIVNVGSTSDYQYLGGTVYEESLLVQSNIITDDDETVHAANIHDDVVAVVAALSAASPDADAADASSGPSASDIHHSDVLGGMLH
jgi:hypothetical protein